MSEEEFKWLSEAYKIAATKLLEDLTKATLLSEIRKTFIEFSRKFTVIPFLWQKWLEYEEKTEYIDFNFSESTIHKKDIINESKKHFYYKDVMEDDAWMYGIDQHLFLPQSITVKAVNLSNIKPTTMKVIEKTLEFPHISLAWNKEMCEQYGTNPLSLKTLKAFKNSESSLQILLKNKENDERTWWCKSIEKHCSQPYIILTYEYKLGEFPSYWAGWRAYITYLSKTNLKGFMLTVYSRYCRFFVGDTFMMEEYISTLISMNILSYNVTLWWIDVIEFYRDFSSFDKAKEMLESILKINKFNNDEIFINYIEWFYNCSNKDESPFIFSLPGIEILIEEFQNEKSDDSQNQFLIKSNNTNKIYFCPKNAKIQLFSLHFNYIYYILKSSKSTILQKLFQSCKYFFTTNQKKLLCYRFGIFEDCDSTFHEQSLFLNAKNLNIFDGINGMTVTNSLQIVSSNSPTATSQILQKINCDLLLHLQLYHQSLSEIEFDLVSGSKIESVLLDYVTVLNNQREKLNVEKITEKFSHANSMGFCMFEEMFNAETSENLGKLNRIKNITYFQLINVPETFDEKFITFIKKFVLPQSLVKIHFSPEVNEEYKQNFNENMKEMIINNNIRFEVY